ncbi:MAG: hypothetical protein RL148_191 [Planctomycetota bacterium]
MSDNGTGWLVALGAGLVFAAAPQPRAQDPQPTPAAPAPAPVKVDFVRDVAPLLWQRCVHCHGAGKDKGDLRLDAREHVLGAEASSIVPGRPEESLLVERILLPVTDEERMPAEGEPLSPKQVEILRSWIAQGAEWPEAGEQWFREAYDRLASKSPTVPELGAAEAAAVDEARVRLVARGVVAQPLADDTKALDVNFSPLGAKATDELWALALPLGSQVVWLNLARSAVTPTALSGIGAFASLQRLNLSGTAVGDEAMEHVAALPNLQVLQLVSTRVTDQGLRRLHGTRSLQRVYLWGSAVSAEGAAALAAALPGVKVDHGAYVNERVQAAAARPVAEPKQPAVVLAQPQCPVSGKPADPAHVFVHEGKTYGFCCANCLAQFRSDPKKYLGR